jgi:hypothetical protein
MVTATCYVFVTWASNVELWLQHHEWLQHEVHKFLVTVHQIEIFPNNILILARNLFCALYSSGYGGVVK